MNPISMTAVTDPGNSVTNGEYLTVRGSSSGTVLRSESPDRDHGGRTRRRRIGWGDHHQRHVRRAVQGAARRDGHDQADLVLGGRR